MPDNPIKHSDIIQSGNPFGDAIKGLEKMLKLTKQLRKEVQTSAKERVKTLEKTNTATKEGREQIKKVAKETQNLTEKDKELLRIQKQLEREKAKLSVANSKEARQLADLKEKNRLANAEMRKTVRAQQEGRKSTNTWNKALGSFAAKFNTIGNVAAMAISKIVGGLTRAIKQFTSLEKIIRSTQASSDKFDQVMGRMKASFEAMNRAIALGDFTNIGRIMREAAAAAQDYVIALDTLGDTQNALNIQTAKTRRRVRELQETYNDTSKSNEERMKALGEAEKILISLQEKQERIAGERIKAERDRIKETFGLTEEQIGLYQRFIENYRLLTDEQVTALEGLESAQTKTEKSGSRFLKGLAMAAGGSQEITKSYVEGEKALSEFDMIAAQLSKTLGFDVLPIMNAIVGTNDEARKALVDATIEYEAQLTATQRLITSLASVRGSIINRQRAEQTTTEVVEESTEATDKETEAIEIQSRAIDAQIIKYGNLLNVKRDVIGTTNESIEATKQDGETTKLTETEKQAVIQDSFAVANRLVGSASAIFEAQKQKELSTVGDNAKKREEIEKKYAKKQQAIAIAQAVIDGALGIQKALSAYPMPLAIPFMLLAAAVTATQIALISSQKFAEGEVDIAGPSHSKGGVPAEIEGGESVINKHATAKHKALLQAINADDTAAIANAALQNEAFHDVWGRANTREVIVKTGDPWTKKMYEIMINTPQFVPDGKRIERYPNGRTRIVNG